VLGETRILCCHAIKSATPMLSTVCPQNDVVSLHLSVRAFGRGWVSMWGNQNMCRKCGVQATAKQSLGSYFKNKCWKTC